ncbi:WD40-repeat-containing domain protein [Umbelopsis sp. PMI_123]|nr:WD40-repeat-containing domain protein [Umbelopsis sp. PMI_123]
MKVRYTDAIHHPSRELIVFSYGKGYYVVNTSNGEIVKQVQPSEEDNKGAALEHFRITSFSKDGNFLATTGDDKEIKIWDTKTWTQQSTRPVLKRINAMQFTNDGSQIVEADKFGDVYVFPTEISETSDAEKQEEMKKNKPIVGHVSMLTDMTLSNDEKYVITADRDEHVRVSRFPNGYNIESYCMGHTDVVTNIQLIPWAPSILATVGGDCTLKLWDFVAGKELQSLDYKSYVEKYVPDGVDANTMDPIVMKMQLSSKDNIAVLSIAKAPLLLVLKWDTNNSIFDFKTVVETPAPVLSFAFDIDGNIWTSMDDNTRVAMFLRKDGSVGRISCC